MSLSTTRIVQRAATLLLLTTVLLACGVDPPPPPVPSPFSTSSAPPVTVTVTSTLPATTATATATATATSATTASSNVVLPQERTVMMVRAIDGDTIEVEGGERVRLIGIDTPEISSPEECYGPEALVRTEELLPVSEQIQLTTDPSQGTQDRYGRTLAYVTTQEGEDLGRVLLQEGFAREYTYSKSNPYDRQAIYLQVQGLAQQGPAGLWKECTQ